MPWNGRYSIITDGGMAAVSTAIRMLRNT